MTERKQRTNKRGQGDGINFLRALIGHDGDDCVIWPFFIEKRRGYGMVGFNGDLHKAHRVMCELAHGPAPSAEYEAAHECGRGPEGCVNPKHLRWKTRIDNQADRKIHGTSGRGPKGSYRRYKLVPADVAEIRKLLGVMSTQDIADRFGVDRSTIRQIQTGKIWRAGSRVPRRFFTPEDVARIKALCATRTTTAVAKEYGVNYHVIYRIIHGRTFSAMPARRIYSAT